MEMIIYLILGYWAAGQTVFKNKIMISSQIGGIFLQKLAVAFILGWILIPVAIIKLIISCVFGSK